MPRTRLASKLQNLMRESSNALTSGKQSFVKSGESGRRVQKGMCHLAEVLDQPNRLQSSPHTAEHHCRLRISMAAHRRKLMPSVVRFGLRAVRCSFHANNLAAQRQPISIS
jgi:hypothetical protein